MVCFFFLKTIQYTIKQSLNSILIATNLWKKEIVEISCGAKRVAETTFTKIAQNNGRRDQEVEE